MKLQSNFGYIRNREPEPLFIDAQKIRPRGKLAKAKKSFPGRGITLFVDAPQPRVIYDTARRRTPAIINREINRNPNKYNNFYQLQKRTLPFLNRVEIRKVDESTNALKLAEVALLAKLVENIDQKEQVAPKTQSSDELERLQAQQTFNALEQENNQLKEELQKQREQKNKLLIRRDAVVADEVKDKREEESQAQKDLEFAKLIAKGNVSGSIGEIGELVAFKARERAKRIEQGLKGIEKDFGVRLEEPARPPTPPPLPPPPEQKELGEGGGLPAYLREIETEKLVEDDEQLVLTEEQEEAFKRKLGDIEEVIKKVKPKKRSKAQQDFISATGVLTRFTGDLRKEINDIARFKKLIPRNEKLIKDLIKQREENEQVQAVVKKDKSNKTRRRNQLTRDIDEAQRAINRARERLSATKETQKLMKEKIKGAEQRLKEKITAFEDETQLKALREDN